MDCCEKHPHERGNAICGRCGAAWCSSCLVYARGPKRPPYCVSCAMYAGGVRTAAARPAMSKRELKARMKAARAESSAAPPTPPVAPVGDETLDWQSPGWDEHQPTPVG